MTPARPGALPSGLAVTFLDEVGQVALAAVVAVEVHGHEDTRPAELVRALPAQARHLVVRVHLVELEHCQLHLLPLVLDLLRLSVGLLLALLATAGELQRQEERRLVSKAALAELLEVLEGPATKNQPLLHRGDP